MSTSSIGADAVVNIEVHVADRDDLPTAITGAAREARKLVRAGSVGTFDEQFCSGAQRISIHVRADDAEAGDDDDEPADRRPETGPMQFGSDWTGVFIRGDYAGPMAMMLATFLAAAEKAGIIDAIEAAPLRGLASDLASCDERGARPGLQRMLPFDECVIEKP